MSMGPILIFDKSVLQSLSVDEACWLENFFLTNITPLFFVETLADLEKEAKSDRTQEQIVGNLALKTPEMGSNPNVHHTTLCIANLLGEEIEMCGVPVIKGGIPVKTGDEKGIIFKQAPEAEAFQRWQYGDFLDVERQYAKLWRQALSGLDFEDIYSEFKRLFGTYSKPKTLADAKKLTEQLINLHGRKESVFTMALDFMGVPQNYRPKILERWKTEGQPLLDTFAPYAAHVFKIEYFFHCSLAADLISRDRPSNKIDLAYLYYLPFCMIFTSNDNLHLRTVPLFLNENQVWIKGTVLKEDFRRLDEHYSALPEDVRNQGIMRFASYPPLEGDFLVAELWDRFLPSWRDSAQEEVKVGRELKSKIMEELQKFKKAGKPLEPANGIDLKNADQVVIERRVSARKGKWRILPPEVEGCHRIKKREIEKYK